MGVHCSRPAAEFQPAVWLGDGCVLTFSGDHVTSEGATVTARKSGDWWTIDVNDYEHYRIPEAVIAGG